jgi:hypothetical protein
MGLIRERSLPFLAFDVECWMLDVRCSSFFPKSCHLSLATCHLSAQNSPPPHQPREAESLLRGQPREAKPFTWTRIKYMAKWEIRFQRFALSFRPSALGHCCFRFPLAFSLQPLAFAIEPREAKPFTRMAKWEIRFQRFALSFRLSPSPRRNSVKTGVPMAGRRREPFTRPAGSATGNELYCKQYPIRVWTQN